MRPAELDGTKVLIAESDPTLRLAIARAFTDRGCQVRATGPASTVLKWAAALDPALAIIDVQRDNAEAYEALRRIRATRPHLPVIVLSDEATLTAAVRAVEAGAFEHFAKPLDVAALLEAAERAVVPVRRETQRGQARARRDEAQPIIGRSAAMQALYRAIARLVTSDLHVLITGESGTGKALIARALHDMGPRRAHPLVTLSLAAESPEGVEARLFGAGPDAPGLLVEADGGTLLLDAVADLSDAAQTRLLRLLDGQTPVVSPATGRPVDVRLVAASGHDLARLVEAGRFRRDLYFRLNVAPLHVPPLRERPEDIPDLAAAFLVRAQREGLAPKALDPWAAQRLQAHAWPGNVRELENLLRRICALYPEELITAAIVERELAQSAPVTTGAAEGGDALARAVALTLATYFADASADRPAALYDQILRSVEGPMILAALQATRGNKVRAAEILGINRNTLRKRIDELGLEPPRRSRPELASVPLPAAAGRIAA
ncbi:MAG: nitrogen regulation protein NR(I) [Phenylobacterium zucineum]|nr:MAG: nitrogen regulation protein NR(I) [Phenylobacterium zucineum]